MKGILVVGSGAASLLASLEAIDRLRESGITVEAAHEEVENFRLEHPEMTKAWLDEMVIRAEVKIPKPHLGIRQRQSKGERKRNKRERWT